MESLEKITVNDVWLMADKISKSNLFGMKKPEEAFALMMIAHAEGKHPAIAARDYDIINGRPAKKSEAMYRDYIASGGTVQWVERSDERAEAIFTHPCQQKPLSVSWDLERVRKAELSGKAMYSKYTRQMLSARVISEGVRATYPAATSGLHVPEEVAHFEPQKPVDLKPRELTPIEAEVVAIDPSEEETVLEEPKRLPPKDVSEDLAALKEGRKPKSLELLEQLKASIERLAKKQNVTTDIATQKVFDDQTGKMTFDKIDKLKTPAQLEKARLAIIKTTTMLLEM